MLISALIFTTIAYGGVHQPIIAIYYVLVTLAGVSWALDSYFKGKLTLSSELLQVPILGAAIYAFVQLIPFGTLASVAGVDGISRTISLDPYSTWTTALQFSALSILFAVALRCLNTRSRISKTCLFLTIFGFIYAFFAILQSIQSPTRIFGIYDVPFGSPFGSFVNRNSFAAYMEMVIALPLGLIFAAAVIKDKRLLYITAVALMGISVLLSDSRGGLVALFCELIILLLLTRKSNSKNDLLMRVGLVVILIAAIIGGSLFVGGDTGLTRFADTAASEDFTTDRSHIWAVTLKVIAANLPFGAGFGAFGVAYPPFDTLSGLLRVEQAHNDYLQVLADAGLPGLFLGGLFLFLFVRLGMRSAKIENTYRRGIALGAFTGCFGVLVHSFFDFVLHVNAVSLLFVTLLALLSACQFSYKDDTKNEPVRHKRKRRSSELEPTEEAALLS